MSLKVTVLGSGTSHGVPMIGCDCAVCRSTDPRDRRTRPSILIEICRAARIAEPPRSPARSRSILVDTSTDLRAQALANDVRRVDAILFTHSHADHVFGLDEVRRFNQMQKTAIRLLRRRADGRRICGGCSRTSSSTPRQMGGGVPQLTLFPIGGPFTLGGVEIVPVPLMHGAAADPRLPHRIVRVPDRLQPHSRRVVAAARRRAHARCSTRCASARTRRTSASPRRSTAVARIGAERAYFTHICHDLPHAATCARLPAGVELAYDGLVLEIR